MVLDLTFRVLLSLPWGTMILVVDTEVALTTELRRNAQFAIFALGIPNRHVLHRRTRLGEALRDDR